MLNEEKQLWNVRKLTERPHCLARCQRTGELKQLLTDYSWLKACVRTVPCADIINWFSDVIPVVPLGRYKWVKYFISSAWGALKYYTTPSFLPLLQEWSGQFWIWRASAAKRCTISGYSYSYPGPYPPFRAAIIQADAIHHRQWNRKVITAKRRLNLNSHWSCNWDLKPVHHRWFWTT